MRRQNYEWSPYQKRLFLEVQRGSGHLIVEARAGSAKTTSIIESFRYVPKGKKVIVLAFNKIIQQEMRERAPSYIQEISTFHSLGYRAIRQRFGEVEIDDHKVFNLLREVEECQGQNDLISNLSDTIAYCKYGLLDSPKDIDYLISRFGIDVCDLDRKDFIRIVIQTLGKDKALTSKIDFNDMCWLHYVYGLELGSFDLCFVDEFQDINASQALMIKKVCKKEGGRIIAVGDPKQDLYSWRMSDSSLFAELKQEAGTQVLSLPISYRCPKKIVELVKPWVPDFSCPENAKEGSIEELSLNKLFDVAKPGCFILSRVNSPLIKLCLGFIRNGIRANIRGRDIGRQLNSIIKRSKKKQIPAFLKWLEKWKEDEVKALQAKGIGTEATLDRYECLTNLCDELGSLEEVQKKIEELFDDTDEKKIVVLSSVHRAKGLERSNVFLLRWTFSQWFDNILPGTEDEFNENLNISYVACTRSADKLYLVNKW
jgi:DNA helicase II / ATP-dependent DNA helicase PcrA